MERQTDAAPNAAAPTVPTVPAGETAADDALTPEDLQLAATAEPFPFYWAQIEDEPKVWRNCLKRAHRTMEYEILHTGGFVRLCTERGRVYWLAQNEHDHRLPDWKIHFSVKPQCVPLAWDILTQLFVAESCDFGMKAVAGEALSSWPASQRGREITVYIFQDHEAYAGGGPMMDLCAKGSEHRFWLGPEFERDADFWAHFIRIAEAALAAAGVETNGGVAAGDLPLGTYASVRNEAFVLERPDAAVRGGRRSPLLYVYPPNFEGWNAAGHSCPLKLPLSVRWRERARQVLKAWGCAPVGCPCRRAHED